MNKGQSSYQKVCRWAFGPPDGMQMEDFSAERSFADDISHQKTIEEATASRDLRQLESAAVTAATALERNAAKLWEKAC